MTPADDKKVLRSFYQKIRPGGPGWKKVIDEAKEEGIQLQKESDLKWDVPTGIICMLLGSVAVYSLLFAIGEGIYGNLKTTLVLSLVTLIAVWLLSKTWKKLKMD